MHSILRLPAVIQATGLSKASIYKSISEGTFPPPVRLGRRAVGWPSDAIQNWIESRPSAFV